MFKLREPARRRLIVPDPAKSKYDSILGTKDKLFIGGDTVCEIIVRNGQDDLFRRACDEVIQMGYTLQHDSSHEIGLDDYNLAYVYVLDGKRLIGSIAKKITPLDIEHLEISSLYHPEFIERMKGIVN